MAPSPPSDRLGDPEYLLPGVERVSFLPILGGDDAGVESALLDEPFERVAVEPEVTDGVGKDPFHRGEVVAAGHERDRAAAVRERAVGESGIEELTVVADDLVQELGAEVAARGS